MKDAFLVIPVRNRREITLRCLRHLRDHRDLDWLNVIVVDDGSTEGTSEAVRKEFREVQLVQATATFGGLVRSLPQDGGRHARSSADSRHAVPTEANLDNDAMRPASAKHGRIDGG